MKKRILFLLLVLILPGGLLLGAFLWGKYGRGRS